MPSAPLAFSDTQIKEILTIGYQLPYALHHVYLQRVAAALRDREFGDADVHRIAHATVRAILAEPRDQKRSARSEVLRGIS